MTEKFGDGPSSNYATDVAAAQMSSIRTVLGRAASFDCDLVLSNLITKDCRRAWMTDGTTDCSAIVAAAIQHLVRRGECFEEEWAMVEHALEQIEPQFGVEEAAHRAAMSNQAARERRRR